MTQIMRISNGIYLKAIFVTFLLALFLTALPQKARADLTIAPLRVTFQDRDRTAEIVLINTSNTKNTYRIGWMHNRQQENGRYETIDTPLNPDFNPEDLIIFSPRQVTIPPGGRQKVRMSLRRPPNMPDGEYRAHLRFQKLADRDTQNGTNDANGIAMSLFVNLGFSIPVMIRQGAYDGDARIENVRLLPASPTTGGTPQLSMTLQRAGKNSTIGRVIVYWVSPEGEETLIGRANNVVIYPERERRALDIPLKVLQIQGGALESSIRAMDPTATLYLMKPLFP